MNHRRTRIAIGLVMAAVIAVTVAGCGFGASPGSKDASIEVTSNFGTQVIGTASEMHIPAAETVIGLLTRHFNVGFGSGGRSVQSIDGRRAATSSHLSWSYFVNGILAAKRASLTDVFKGDHIWWDLHDTTATSTVPAVVGSYPEPFTDGLGGQEFPTLLECAPNLQRACDTVGSSLKKYGVKAGPQVLGTGSGSDSLAVVVGTWNDVKGVIAAELIAGGPSNSGVYAQFIGSSGQALELDNPLGDVAQTLRGNVGLIAATDEVSLGAPTWFVIGTNTAAVNNAAKYFTVAALHNHFAVAITGSKVIPVPLTGR